MKHNVDVTWDADMAFDVNVGDHTLRIDAGEKVGGKNSGPPPKPLMLAALGGCTGMDVVSILRKMRVDLTYFNVKVEADSTEEHPKHYYKMKIIYEFKGNNLDREKLEKAVNLSEEKYCGVSEVYRKAMELSTEIRILED